MFQSYQRRISTVRLYDRLSRWYDLLSGPAEARARRQAVGLLAVQSGETVLEIGSGTGSLLTGLAEAVGDDGQVIGLDISAGMLRVAINRVRSYPNILLVHADALCLPFSNHQVDAVLMCFVLELFRDEEIPDLLSEIRRVLKPSGRGCVLALSRPVPEPLSVKIYDWLHKFQPSWFDCQPMDVRCRIIKNSFSAVEVQSLSIFGLPVEIVRFIPA